METIARILATLALAGLCTEVTYLTVRNRQLWSTLRRKNSDNDDIPRCLCGYRIMKAGAPCACAWRSKSCNSYCPACGQAICLSEQQVVA